MKYQRIRGEIIHDSFQGPQMNDPLFTDINDCASQPCKNNGTCKDQVNSFICDCNEGYTGLTCETSKQKWSHMNISKVK